MSIAFTCQSCGKKYSVKDEFSGKRVKCAACGTTMMLPEAKASKPLPPPAKAVQQVIAPKTPAASQGSIFDELELEGTASSTPGKRSGVPVMAGHILQPQLDPSEIDEFELEPPAQTKIDVGVFMEDDPGASPAPKGKPASGKKGAAKPAAKSAPADDADGFDLTVAEDPHEVAPPPEPTVPCPGCNEAIKPNSVLCIHCGLNLKTGEKIEGAKKGGFGKLFGGLKRDK